MQIATWTLATSSSVTTTALSAWVTCWGSCGYWGRRGSPCTGDTSTAGPPSWPRSAAGSCEQCYGAGAALFLLEPEQEKTGRPSSEDQTISSGHFNIWNISLTLLYFTESKLKIFIKFSGKCEVIGKKDVRGKQLFSLKEMFQLNCLLH